MAALRIIQEHLIYLSVLMGVIKVILQALTISLVVEEKEVKAMVSSDKETMDIIISIHCLQSKTQLEIMLDIQSYMDPIILTNLT